MRRADLDGATLAHQELEILVLLADGHTAESAAQHLHVSARTLRRRLHAACRRVGARGPMQLVAWAARRGDI